MTITKYFVHRCGLYWVDLIFLVFFGIVGILCHFAMDPYNRFFLERDPTLSYPYEVTWGDQAIPNSLIVILVIPIPMVLLVCWVLFWRFCMKLQPIKNDRRVIDPLLALLGFLEAMAITFAVTEFLKNFVGRKRPNFFAMCNYKGFRDALRTGNFTEYNSITVAGAIGDLKYCRENNPSIVSDSQFSFPSGHSSSSFCALTYCANITIHTLNHWTRRFQMIKVFAVLIFIWSAAVIAGTRPRDYWHNFDDVLAGGILGGIVGYFVFSINYQIKLIPELSKYCAKCGCTDPEEEKENTENLNSPILEDDVIYSKL